VPYSCFRADREEARKRSQFLHSKSESAKEATARQRGQKMPFRTVTRQEDRNRFEKEEREVEIFEKRRDTDAKDGKFVFSEATRKGKKDSCDWQALCHFLCARRSVR
jgi:hypothetical protein